MSGAVVRGKDCEANSPLSQSRWRTLLLVYDQSLVTPPYDQPATFTPMISSAEPPYNDPGFVTVMTQGVVSVRNVNPAGPVVQVDPLSVDLGVDGGALPPGTTNDSVGAPLKLSGRGVATPQYRVRWSLGNAEAVAFVDSGCMLSMPAASVSVDALTQTLLLPATDGTIDDPTATVSGTLLTEARVSASVSWAKRNGASAPQGMATFTQVNFTDSTNPVLFERPPFARRVVCIPPENVAGRWVFLSELGTPQLLVGPPPLSNVHQVAWDVPASAVGVAFVPTNDDDDQLMSVTWEIGVR